MSPARKMSGSGKSRLITGFVKPPGAGVGAGGCAAREAPALSPTSSTATER